MSSVRCAALLMSLLAGGGAGVAQAQTDDERARKIVGAEVTFTLADPVTSPYSSNPSDAAFCAGAASVTVSTDATGAARLTFFEEGTAAQAANDKAMRAPKNVRMRLSPMNSGR